MRVTKSLGYDEFTAEIEFIYDTDEKKYILDDQNFELIKARDTFLERDFSKFQKEKWNHLEQRIFEHQDWLFEEEFKAKKDCDEWEDAADRADKKRLEQI